MVIVNPGKVAAEYSWDSTVHCYDVCGKALQSPIKLKARTAMLLIRDTSVLRSWGTHLNRLVLHARSPSLKDTWTLRSKEN